MGDSMRVALNDALRMVGIVEDTTRDGSDIPQASWDLYEMIQAFTQAPSYHLIFELGLIVWIVRLLFFTKSYKPERTVLTEKEKEELIEEWQPEPLVPDVDEDHPVLHDMEHRLVDSKISKYVSINGRKCLNMASLNFLAMSGRADIEEVAVKSLRKYGVGSCGPRGFYGTVGMTVNCYLRQEDSLRYHQSSQMSGMNLMQHHSCQLDVHLKLEEKIEQFMGCEEAIVYSYGFATIASAIPAYSKRGDVIFADEGVHFAIQKGIQASRSKVVYFKHNDMEDLERHLLEQQRDDKKNPKKAKVTRRFLVVEGLYMNYGDICPLPRLVELKHKYKVRIFMDESVSFGTLGKTGRGATEHYNIPVEEVDLIAGSLENAIASVGGFCAGKAYVIDHQRLSGLGYCFSASAPPMLCDGAITALDILDQNPDLLNNLHDISKYAHKKFTKLDGLTASGDDISPIIHLRLTQSSGDHDTDYKTLRNIVQLSEEQNIALTTSAYLKDELFMPQPSIRLPLNAELTTDDIDHVVEVLQSVLKKVL